MFFNKLKIKKNHFDGYSVGHLCIFYNFRDNDESAHPIGKFMFWACTENDWKQKGSNALECGYYRRKIIKLESIF